METLSVNVSGSVRREQLHGRNYLVAPVSLIVPGVLNGSKGPLLYPQEEVEKNPDAWNMMPLVVNHPTKAGKPISARIPAILEEYSIGYVFNASVDGKLKAEAWFDEELTEAKEPRIKTWLETNTPFELSTGLFTTNDEAPEGSVHNGRPYKYTARNYRPDHLAVLPDQVGACSLNDGCGVLVNKEAEVVTEEVTDNEMKTVGGEELPASAFAYVPDPQKPSTWKLRIDDKAHVGAAIAAISKGFRGQKVDIPEEDIRAVKDKIRDAWLKFHPGVKEEDIPRIIVNQMSHADLYERLTELIRATLPKTMGLDGPMTSPVYVVDVFDKYFIYRDQENDLWKRSYTTDLRTDELTIGSDPVRVQKKERYTPVENFNPNQPRDSRGRFGSGGGAGGSGKNSVATSSPTAQELTDSLVDFKEAWSKASYASRTAHSQAHVLGIPNPSGAAASQTALKNRDLLTAAKHHAVASKSTADKDLASRHEAAASLLREAAAKEATYAAMSRQSKSEQITEGAWGSPLRSQDLKRLYGSQKVSSSSGGSWHVYDLQAKRVVHDGMPSESVAVSVAKRLSGQRKSAWEKGQRPTTNAKGSMTDAQRKAIFAGVSVRSTTRK